MVKKKKERFSNSGKSKIPKQIKKFEFQFDFDLKKILTWLLIGFLILSFIFSLRGPIPQGSKDLTQVLKDIKAEKERRLSHLSN